MRTIFFVVSRGGLLRRYAESSVLRGLSNIGFRIIILTPPSDEDAQLAPLLSDLNVVFEPLALARKSFTRLILQELQRAVIYNDTVRARFVYTIASKKDPSRLLYFPRTYIFPLIRHIPRMKAFLRTLGQLADPQKEHDKLFSKYKPSLIFSTTPHDETEASILKGAKRFKVPIICMPKSWDNLSKILFPVKGTRMLVWSPQMKKEAIELQDYLPEEIFITGALQFDTYADPAHLWTREEFARRHGLDPQKKIILYGSSGADMCDEARFVDLLEDYLATRDDIQVLIRPHAGYRDDGQRFRRFEGRPGFYIDRSIYQLHSERTAWDANPDKVKNLYNSLYHANVCVNVASTLTIDATICGTPVINLNFDVDQGVDPKKRSVKRLFETGYTKAIMSFGATWLVRSKQEFVAALSETLANKQARVNERNRLIEAFAFKKDGAAARRIIEGISTL